MDGGDSSGAAAQERARRLQALRVERQSARLASQRLDARRSERQRQVLSAAAGLGLAALLAGGGALALALSGSDGTPQASRPSPTPEPSATASAGPVTCDFTATKAPGVGVPGSDQRPARTATLATTAGPLKVDVDVAGAPCAARSLAFLARHRYYDGRPCTRLTTGPLHFLQCGNPVEDDAGYVFAEEGASTATYRRGTVALVNKGKGTTSATFIVVLADTQLPVGLTRVGTVTSGLDALDAVAAVGAVPKGDGRPLDPVSLTSVRVTI